VEILRFFAEELGGINSEAVYARKVKYYLYRKTGSSTMAFLKKEVIIS